MNNFRVKLLGLLRLLLPLHVSGKVMEMLEDDSVTSEKVKEYVVKVKEATAEVKDYGDAARRDGE